MQLDTLGMGPVYHWPSGWPLLSQVFSRESLPEPADGTYRNVDELVRIVTIWFLATHINSDFMYGNLHRNGGMLFSLISVALLLVSLYWLRRLEGLGEQA